MEVLDNLSPWDLFADYDTDCQPVPTPAISAVCPELETVVSNVGSGVNRLKDIESRLNSCNDVLKQLMVACRLKQQIESCASGIAEPTIRSSYKVLITIL